MPVVPYQDHRPRLRPGACDPAPRRLQRRRAHSYPRLQRERVFPAPNAYAVGDVEITGVAERHLRIQEIYHKALNGRVRED